MISVKLAGGLGNQLFQIFCCIAYSLRYNLDFVLPDTTRDGFRKKTYWDNLLMNLKCYLRKEIKLKKFNEKQFHFKEILEVDNIILNGYFQSWKYFIDKYDQIYKLLDLDSKKIPYKVKNACSMHFRLGDYKFKQDFHNLLPIEYYDKALDYLVNHTRDDWDIYYFCESQDNRIVKLTVDELKNKYNNLNFIKVSDEKDDWEQLLMMSNCEHNIIANSTFSWWGSFLNSNKKKIVVCPDIWFGPHNKNNKIDDLFYQNCVRIKF